MSDVKPPVRAPSVRDPRLDVFRGICLVMIFINHVPGNLYEEWTSRNFGFSDAAEGFVLMSGVAAGLAYSMDFRGFSRFWTGLARVWRRVWTLYLVHILTTVLALGAASAVAVWLNDSQLLFENQMKWIWADPLRTFIGIPLLTHQFGYVNILPLYLVLLFVSPVLLMLAWRWPVWLMVASVAFWAATAQFRLTLPNYPSAGGWFFNPAAWQVIFIAGLLTGVAQKDGRRFVPVRLWLQVLTGGFVFFAYLTTLFPDLARAMGQTLWSARQAGAPWFLTNFDKTFVTAPRLLHIMALAYFLSTFPIVRTICGSWAGAPFALLGRQALPVFATGTVLAIALQGVKHATGPDPAMDNLFIGGGLALQFALAAARTYWPKGAKPRAD